MQTGWLVGMAVRGLGWDASLGVLWGEILGCSQAVLCCG